MPQRELPKAYLTYPKTDETEALLTGEIETRGIRLQVGEHVFESMRQIPLPLLKDIIEYKDPIITEVPSRRRCGISKVFGIWDTKTRYLSIDGKPHIRIRIIAPTTEMIFKKIGAIKEKMGGTEVASMKCAWDHFGSIEFDENNKHYMKKRPNFDKQYVHDSRVASLEAYLDS